jgi:hypothetical protein
MADKLVKDAELGFDTIEEDDVTDFPEELEIKDEGLFYKKLVFEEDRSSKVNRTNIQTDDFKEMVIDLLWGCDS